MSMTKFVPIKANVKLRVEHIRDGKLIWSHEKEEDLLVNAGLNYLCEVIGNTTQPAEMGYTAIGEDATAPEAAQTTLLSEAMRVANSYSKDGSVGEASLDATFNITATYALNECGLFNDPAAGTMYCRDTFTTRNVIDGDTVNLYYTITFSVA